MIITDAVPATSGQLIGAYRLVSMLGTGGMGAVWLAEHTLLGRRVAIKFLHAEVSRDPANVERFFAEARAATRIADPGIIVVYDFGWHTDNGAYIVMELLGGESVAARLRAGRFSVSDAVRVVQQSATAMAVAHGRGIIHRDLKPDNIFLIPDPSVTGGERIKILDFGIAKLVGDEHGTVTRTRTGAIMGTPTYMSPEQCRGVGDIDQRTDIYALGCVLFELLCGRLPFVGSTPGDMIASHLLEAPQPPSALSPAVPDTIDAIVLRCLAKDAKDRYATMTELAGALAAAMGEPGRVSAIGDDASVARRPRRRRALAIAVGVALLATSAVAAIGLATSTPSSSPAARPGSGERPDSSERPERRASAPPADSGNAPPADAGNAAPADARAVTAPAVVAPVSIDGGNPVVAPRKPATRPRARPAAPDCKDDPYACP
jgi:serine/threonine protein kinase